MMLVMFANDSKIIIIYYITILNIATQTYVIELFLQFCSFKIVFKKNNKKNCFQDKEQISGFDPELGEVPTDAQLSVWGSFSFSKAVDFEVTSEFTVRGHLASSSDPGAHSPAQPASHNAGY